MLIGFIEISNLDNGIELLEIVEKFFLKQGVKHGFHIEDDDKNINRSNINMFLKICVRKLVISLQLN